LRVAILVFKILVFVIYFQTSSFSKEYNIGDKVQNYLILNNYFKIPLSKGSWEVVRKEQYNWRTLNQRIVGVGRVNNNKVVEIIEIYEGLLSGKYVGAVDHIINEIVFYDKYDGCYQRPEYYLLELYRKGSTHNCMVIRHVDVFKLLKSRDDPSKRGYVSSYNHWINSNNYEVPKITLGSEHSYFSRLMRGNWFQISRVIDPDILNAPKSKYFSEEASEYHSANISNYPKHKEIMDKWISLSSKFHKEFENNNNLRSHHKLNLENYIKD